MSKLIIIAIAVAVLIMVLGIGWKNTEYKEFMKTAVKTRAEILEREERIADQKTRRKEYWITYRYTDKDERVHTNQVLVEYADIWQRIRRGQVLEAYYNPENPAQSYLAPIIERRMGIAAKLPGNSSAR